jgi:hypothetical protein
MNDYLTFLKDIRSLVYRNFYFYHEHTYNLKIVNAASLLFIFLDWKFIFGIALISIIHLYFYRKASKLYKYIFDVEGEIQAYILSKKENEGIDIHCPPLEERFLDERFVQHWKRIYDVFEK